MKVTRIVILSFFLLAFFELSAQNNSPITLQYKSGMNLRELAAKYIGNPDLWQEILYDNGLQTVDQLKDGMQITIDAEKIKATQKIRQEAKDKIDEANKQGAKLFAGEIISASIKSFDSGLNNAKKGEWDKSISDFTSAKNDALKAIEEVKKKRVVDSEAFLSFRKGRVERRSIEERTWSDAPLKSKLFVEDRARTLSDSYAEISFTDKSKIRLNENSQAVIKKSRMDLLNKKSENSVRLEKGDAFALFSKGARKQNEIEVPGVDVKVNSSFFWVEKDEETTRFANYEGEIKLTSNDSSVTLAQNQGSIIPKGGVPSAPIELLDPPAIVSPDMNSDIYKSTVDFSWQSVDEAQEYILVVSKDVKRENIVRSIKKIKSNSFTVENLEPGFYYVNVSSVDKYGFPGAYGEARGFNIIRDETKPYLVIESPENNYFTNIQNLAIEGETEAGIIIKLNGVDIPVKGKSINSNYDLEEGYNKLEFEAVDKAGNLTKIVREVYYEREGKVNVKFSEELNQPEPGVFVTAKPTMVLSGITSPQASVDITGTNNPIKLRAYADNSGMFNFNLSNLAAENNFNFNVNTPGGNSYTEEIKIILESKKPQVVFDVNIPASTSQSPVEFRGKVTSTDVLSINGTNIPLINGAFFYSFELTEGTNRISFEAGNSAGSTTKISRIIKYDSTPPEIVKDEINRITKGDEAYLTLKIYVKDSSQLKKNAIAKITSSSFSATKYLTLGGKKDFYFGEIPIPQHAGDKKLNIEIEAEDYLGNKKVYKVIK